MTRRLLASDRLSGLRTYHSFDPAAGRTTLTYSQDVEPLLVRNKAAQNDAVRTTSDMVHVASIPASVQLQWLIEKGVDLLDPDHKQAVAKLLDDPEWRYLKVRNIILGRV